MWILTASDTQIVFGIGVMAGMALVLCWYKLKK